MGGTDNYAATETFLHGGKVIGSGGFGCVFRPALQCQKHQQPGRNIVSKMLIQKDAFKEMQEVKSFRKTLQEIPNYQNYFIFPEDSCVPKHLSKSDLEDFTENCKTMKQRRNIDESNINRNLKNLRIIQLQDGGVDMDHYFTYRALSSQTFPLINKRLQTLLIKGIIPMNQKRVYHMDIKSSNVMIADDTKPRVIDWGLSRKITNNDKIPDSHENLVKIFKNMYQKTDNNKSTQLLRYLNRPLHYNLPPTIIVFNPVFYEKILDYVDDIGNVKSINNREFAIYLENAYNESVVSENLARGHEDLILHLIQEYIYPTKNPRMVLFRYIADALIPFIKTGNFKLNDFLHHHFLEIVDVWGFSTIYLLMNIDKENSLPKTNVILPATTRKKFNNAIIQIIRKYFYETAGKPISRKRFISSLEGLDRFFSKGKENAKLKILHQNEYDSNKSLRTNLHALCTRTKSRQSTTPKQSGRKTRKQSRKTTTTGSLQTKKNKSSSSRNTQ